MPRDVTRITRADLRGRKSARDTTRHERSHGGKHKAGKQMSEQELMELEALEMSLSGPSQDRHAVSYFEWQARSSRPQDPAPTPRAGPIKRLLYRLTGRG